jgi:hypothetical protein
VDVALPVAASSTKDALLSGTRGTHLARVSERPSGAPMQSACISQHSLNLHGPPTGGTRCRDSRFVQRLRDPCRARDPFRSDGVDDGQEVGGAGCRLRLPSFRRFGVSVLGQYATQAPRQERRKKRNVASLEACLSMARLNREGNVFERGDFFSAIELLARWPPKTSALAAAARSTT